MVRPKAAHGPQSRLLKPAREGYSPQRVCGGGGQSTAREDEPARLRSVNSLKRVPEGGGQSQFDSKTRKLGTVPCADSPGTFGTVPGAFGTVPSRFKKPALKQDKRQLPAGIPQAIYPVVHAGDVRATKDVGMLIARAEVTPRRAAARACWCAEAHRPGGTGATLFFKNMPRIRCLAAARHLASRAQVYAPLRA